MKSTMSNSNLHHGPTIPYSTYMYMTGYRIQGQKRMAFRNASVSSNITLLLSGGQITIFFMIIIRNTRPNREKSLCKCCMIRLIHSWSIIPQDFQRQSLSEITLVLVIQVPNKPSIWYKTSLRCPPHSPSCSEW